MVDKVLTEAHWKSAAGDLGLNAPEMPKLLAQVAKAEKAGPKESLAALEALDKQRSKLEREHKANKAALKLFDQMGQAIAGARKQAQKDLAEEEASASDDEADSPDLLSSKMLPLLRELKKGELRMSALISTAGRNTAVLVMRKSIPSSRFKMMAQAVDATGGVKHIRAECLVEQGTLTFVVEGQGGGLAKRIREALLNQTGQRLKVQVRGEDGSTDEDGEDDPDQDSAPVAPTASTSPPESRTQAPPDPARQAYETKAATVAARVQQALSQQHPQSTKLRALIGFASDKAAANDLAGATKALTMIEDLLGVAAAPPPTAPTATPSTAGGEAAAFNTRLAAMMPRLRQLIAGDAPSAGELRALVAEAGQLAQKRDYAAARQRLDRLDELVGATAKEGGAGRGLAAWRAARQAAIGQLKALGGHIAQSDHPRRNAAQVLLRAIQANLSANPSDLRTVNELQRYLEDDDIVKEAERPNGYGLQVDLRAPLLAALKQLQEEVDA